MYAVLLRTQNHESFDLSTLKICVSGGSAMPVEVMKAFEDALGCIVLEGNDTPEGDDQIGEIATGARA